MQTVNGRYHSTKRHLVGNGTTRPAPAWRSVNFPNGAAGPSKGVSTQMSNGSARNINTIADPGSKIIITNLPQDVREGEISDLMKKTVGPLKDTFVIYNSQGLSKGMAVVVFQRAGDARRARITYDNKVVDNRRPLKIELIVDNDMLTTPPEPPKAKEKSLFERIGGPVNGIKRSAVTLTPTSLLSNNPARKIQEKAGQNRRIRQKKGPRRVKKSVEQLDKEMEDYRLEAEASLLG